MKSESNKSIEDLYKELKIKYSKKMKENKNLKTQLDDMVTYVEKFQSSYNSIIQMYNNISESIKSIPQTKKEDNSIFSTYVTDMKPDRKASMNYNETSSIVKRLEEMEINFNEMTKSFNHLVIKYKVIQDERNKLEYIKESLEQDVIKLKNSRDELYQQIKYKDNLLERFKEINKCLIDSSLNSCILNTNEHKKDSNLNPYKGAPYITCEPLPTFLKFINKFSNN